MNLVKRLKQVRTAVKAARPKMSMDLTKAQSAQEVGEMIANSWTGYGLREQSGDATAYRLVVDVEPKTFDDAMRYLWYKPAKLTDGSTLWKMMGSKFGVRVQVNGKTHTITVQRV